tara:strand:- start:2313 stop:2489 length:177 start_codon:yes stop_codon:yes gene_type:complete
MRKKPFSFFQTNIFLNEKKQNLKKENKVETIARTFLSSLIIISIFFITPLVVNFTKKK